MWIIERFILFGFFFIVNTAQDAFS